MDANLTVEMINNFPDLIVGIKLAHFNGYNWRPVDEVTKAGRLSERPVMIDFGGSKPEMNLDSLLNYKLRKGDIYTHVYANVNGRTAIVKDNVLNEYVKSAQKKGFYLMLGMVGVVLIFLKQFQQLIKA